MTTTGRIWDQTAMTKRGEVLSDTTVNVELVQVPYREGAQPFGNEHTGYAFNWCSGMGAPEKESYYRGMLDGAEVVRVRLSETVYLSNYGMQHIEGVALKIVAFEVRDDRRGQGIGRVTVAELMRQLPGRRLVAFSADGAEDFWSSLGWERREPPRDSRGPDGSPAFIQPA